MKQMRSALIVFGSTTGNTEFAAEIIEEYLKDHSYDVRLVNVSEVEADILKETYDLYLLGCSTWGDEEVELQEDFELFYEGMTMDLDQKKFAVFGCGDTSYTYFCGAVDAIEGRLKKLGADLVSESLRIDGEPEETEVREWIEDVINAA
jgi:flavodoxin I